jgi:hypothetical protein
LNSTRAVYRGTANGVNNNISSVRAVNGRQEAAEAENAKRFRKIEDELEQFADIANQKSAEWAQDKTNKAKETAMMKAVIDMYEYLTTVPSYIKANKPLADLYMNRTKSMLAKPEEGYRRKGGFLYGVYMAYKAYADVYKKAYGTSGGKDVKRRTRKLLRKRNTI